MRSSMPRGPVGAGPAVAQCSTVGTRASARRSGHGARAGASGPNHTTRSAPRTARATRTAPRQRRGSACTGAADGWGDTTTTAAPAARNVRTVASTASDAASGLGG
jgi:hypothetical protein